MKKYILIAFLFVFTASMGQIIPKVDGWVTKPKAAPGTPVDGEVYYDSTTKKTYQWNGTSWIDWSSVISLDATLINGSTNGVENNAVFDALALKVNKTGGNLFATDFSLLNGSVNGSNGILLDADTASSIIRGGITGSSIVDQFVGSNLWAVDFEQNGVGFDYSLNSTGTPSLNTDLITKSYADANYINGGTPADNSVTSAKIVDGSIATADYSDLSITGVKIANGAVSNTKLLADAVDGSKVQDGSLSGLDIANGSLSVSELSATGVASASTYLRGDNTWAAVASGGGDVTAASTFTDNKLMRSDGTAKGVQTSGITVDDSSNVTGLGTINTKTISELIPSKTTGLTGAVAITNIVAGTTANIAGWTADPNRLAIPTDARPASIETGTALDLGGYIQYNTTPSAATTYTTTNFKTGGYAEAFINTTSEPVITGGTKLPGTAAWETGVDMLMCVKALGNATVKYFFVKL